MTQPEQLPPFDVGNPFALQAMYPAALFTGEVDGPDGTKLMVVTVRVGPGTVSAILPKQKVIEWAAFLNAQASNMSDVAVVQSRLILPGQNGGPQR